MSRSFAIIFRETREKTPDPARPGKTLTQERMAEILGVHINTIRLYEWGKRLPHELIRRELRKLFPEISNTV